MDLYDSLTTKFHTRDALGLIGSKCVMLCGSVSQEFLGRFAAAESSSEAQQLLSEAQVEPRHFGDLSAVVPDYKIARRHHGRKAAHDLLDITLLPSVKGGEGKFLFEPDPKSLQGQKLDMESFRSMDPDFERVVYVPFVPDMIARIDADRSGSTAWSSEGLQVHFARGRSISRSPRTIWRRFRPLLFKKNRPENLVHLPEAHRG